MRKGIEVRRLLTDYTPTLSGHWNDNLSGRDYIFGGSPGPTLTLRGLWCTYGLKKETGQDEVWERPKKTLVKKLLSEYFLRIFSSF